MTNPSERSKRVANAVVASLDELAGALKRGEVKPNPDSGEMRCSPSFKISREEVRRHFEECVKATKEMELSQESVTAFIIGFRMYERMAMHLGKQITEDESRRFVPKKQVDGEAK